MRSLLVIGLFVLSSEALALFDSYISTGKSSIEVSGGEAVQEIKSITKRLGLNLDPLPGLNLSLGVYAEQSVGTGSGEYLDQFEQHAYGVAVRSWLNIIPGLWAFMDLSYLVDGNVSVNQKIGGYGLTGIASYADSQALTYKLVEGASFGAGMKITMAYGHRVLVGVTVAGANRGIYSGSLLKHTDEQVNDLNQGYSGVSLGYEWSL